MANNCKNKHLANKVVQDFDWWEDFVKEEFPNEKCLHYFKCSRKTFTYFLKALRPYVTPVTPKTNSSTENRTAPKRTLSLETQVGVLFYKLVNNGSYFAMSKIFKLQKSTIDKAIFKCVTAINKFILHDKIKLPNKSEAFNISRDFEQLHEIPQLIGILFTVHLPVHTPPELSAQFTNPKSYTSFILQTVIDSNCYFRDISVRHAGAIETKLVLQESNIFKYSHRVLPTDMKKINGVDVPYKIVGTLSSPHLPWLLNDYLPAITPAEALFNDHLEKVRNYADSVIARLRSRFLILSQMMDQNYKMAPQIIAACCVIHNICEQERDPFLEGWLYRYMELSKRYPQPNHEIEKWDEPDSNTFKQRDALRDYLFQISKDDNKYTF